MGDNIKVVVKVRPLIKRELQDKLPCIWQVDDNSIYHISNDGKNQRFTFDRVYDQNTEISDVYNDIAKPIVESATAGINGTIFAYGQTSSGKTFTMMGEEKAPGIIPQAIYNIFENIQNNPNRDYLLRVSYIEIYNEKIKDLLDVEKKDIKIGETPQGIKVEASEVVTNSPEQVLEIMNKGVQNRQIGSTNMNEQSSRSHTIFQIIIESKHHAEEDEEQDGCVNVSQLNLVDLAGSERSGQTGATGQRFKEGTHINKSLLSLGLVIKQLSEDPHKYVNYRDSKLTRILQNSLGGNAKTSIICAVTPAALDETVSTLQFANRAKAVKNAPIVNAVATDATMLASLMKKLSQLQYELESKKHLEEDNKQLTQKIRSLQNKIVHGEMVPQGWQASNNRRQTWCAPRRLTIAAIPGTAGLMGPPKTVRSALPVFVTPSLERCPPRSNVTTRKPSVLPNDDVSFVITEDFKEMDMSPINTPAVKKPKKHLRKSVKFSDEVIDLEAEEISKSDTSTCSPDHKCFGTSRTPPCKLRSRVKNAEKELSELIELTSLEKMYPPTEVELITRARHLAAKVYELECNGQVLIKHLQERDGQIATLEKQIDDCQKEKNEALSDLAKAQEQCASLNDKLNDMENQKVKAKNREMELLSQLEASSGNNPALSAGDNCKNDINQVSMLSQFIDLSKDVSLVNNSAIDESMVNEHSKSNNFQNIQITNLEMQLDEKNKIIAELNEKLSNNKKIMTTLRKECLEKTDKFDLLVEKLSTETTTKAKMSQDNSELHKKIASLEAQLENASKDVQSYSQLVLDMQQAASRSDTSTANPIITESGLSEIIRVRQRLTKNNEELQASIESFKTSLNQKDAELEKKYETIELISARADEYAELLDQKNQDLADVENERLQLLDQISDQAKVAYNLEVNLFETRQKMQHDIKMLQDEKESILQEKVQLSKELNVVVVECKLCREKIEAIELIVSEKDVLIRKLNDEISNLKDNVEKKEGELQRFNAQIDDFNQMTSKNNNQDKEPCCDGSCEIRILEIKDICNKSENVLRREIEKLSNQNSTSPEVQASSCDCIKADFQSNSELMATKKILETTNTEMKILQAEINNAIGTVAKQESIIQRLEQECLCKDQEIEKLTKINTEINNNNAVLDNDLKNAKQDLNENRRVIKGLEESLCGAKDATLKQIEVNKNIYDVQLSKSEEVIHNITLEMSKKQDTIKLNSVKIHRLEAELKETVDKLEKCKLEVESVNTTIRNITNKLSEKEEQLGQSLQKCEECVAEIKRLNIIISDMGNVKPEPDQTALQEALQQSENYKIEIELLVTKADEMALKLSEKETRLGQLDYEYREALNKIERYNSDIHKFNLTIEKQKETINAYEISLAKVNIRDNDFQETLDKCTEQSKEIVRLNDAVRDLGEKLLEKEDLIKMKDYEIGEAVEKGAHFDLIVKKLKSDLDALNRKLLEKEVSITEMSDEILEKVLEKYKLENEKLQVIISEEKNKVFEIEKTLTERDNREKQLQNTLDKCKISDVEVARLNGIIKDLTYKFNERETIALVNNDSKLQKAIDNCKKFELLNEGLTTELESKSAELAEKERDLTGLRGVIDKHEQEYKKLKETLSLNEFKKIESAFIESNKKDEQLRKALEKCNECASEINYLKTVLREMAVQLSDREVDLGEGDKLLKVHGAIEKCTKCDSEIEQLNVKLDQLNTKLTEKKVMLIKMSEEDDALQESLLELKNCDLEVEKLEINVDEKPPQVSHDATSAWTKNVGEQLLSALEKCTKYKVEIDNLNSIITEMTAKLDMQGDRKSDLTQESSESNFEIDNEKEDSISSGTGQTTESTYGENLKQYELHINEYKSQVEELQLSNSDMAALLDLLTNENLMFESKFEILQSENEGLRTNNKYLTELNEELTNEISEAEEQVVFLMESIKQLQARIVWHRMNVSTLTATSNTENKLLRSKLISAQHHHNRLHTLCQREVADMKLQLEKLHVLMQSEMSYYQSPYKQAFSMVHKRDLGRNYLSTPTNASFNVTQSEYASFIDDASFTSDMLMLQTNVSINVDDTSAKVAHNDITLIDSTVKSKSYMNASCQTESPKIIDCRKKLEYCTLDKTDATCQTATDDIFEKLQKECSELHQKCEVFSKNNEKMILSLKQAKKEKEEIQEENDSLSNDIMDRLTELDSLKEEIVEYKKEISDLKNKETHEDRAPSKLINAKGTQTSLDQPLNTYDQGDYTALKHEVCALKLELTEVLNARDILLVKLEQIIHLENKNSSSQTNNDPTSNTSSKEYSSSEKPTHMLNNTISKIKCELDARKEECCQITNELASMKSYIHDSEETSKKMRQELENSFKIVNLQENLDTQINVSYEDQNCLDKVNISKVKDCGSENDERNYNQLQEENLNLQRTVENLRIDLTQSSEQCDNLSKEKTEIKKLCERYIAKLCDNVIFSHTNMNTVEMLNSLIKNMDAKYKNEAENLQIQFNTLREEKFEIEKKITELTRDNEKFNLALMEKTNQCSKLTTNINDLSTRLGVLQSEFDLKQKTENEIKNKCGQYILQFVEEKTLNSALNGLQLIDMLVTSVCNRYSSEGKKIILERECQLNEVFNKYKLLSNELECEKQKCENLVKLTAKLKEMNEAVTLDNVRYKEEIDGQHSLKSKLELNYQNIVEAFEEIKNELKTEKITLSKMMEENKRITGENVKLNNEISILKSNLTESKQNVEALTNSLTKARNDSNNLKEHYIRDLNILQVQIKDLEKEMINLKNLNNILCDQNKKAADQLNACESARMKNQKDMAAMSEEIGHLKALLEEKTMEVTHQLKINSQLRLNSKQKADNDDALSEELKKKSMEVEALTVNNSTLNKSNNILTSILSRLNAETESLKLQLSEQSQKYEDDTNKYKKELKKLQEQLELNNLEVRHGGHPNIEIVEPKVAARKKRQSWHDQSRLSNEYPQSAVSNDSDSQTIAELRSENIKLNAVIAELRDKAVQLEKLEFDLETSKGAMGYDFDKFSEETIPKSREQARISDCTPRARRQSLHDQSRIALPDVRSIGTNTIQGFDSDLLSMVVDRMTFEAQLERNRTLQQQVENLRERNRQLSAELRGHTNAASVSMDAEQIQQDLEQLRRENENLQVRLKEVDEECEICAQYLRQKEKDYDNLREIKIGLEKRVAELEGKSEMEEPRNLIRTTRKRRQSIHDQSRSQLSVTTTVSPDGADRLRSELTKKQREVQDLKEMVVDLRNQIDIMQVDKNTSGGENVARAGSAIVQNQKISDYIAEMCRLRRVNAKLVNLCKKRGKEVDSDGNTINVET